MCKLYKINFNLIYLKLKFIYKLFVVNFCINFDLLRKYKIKDYVFDQKNGN